MTFDALYAALVERAKQYGIRVSSRSLPPETPAEFEGPSITLDPANDPESRCYYLAHALGSIAEWSMNRARTQAIFDELHAAQASRAEDPNRFVRAVSSHLAFEERASSHAVWLFSEIECGWAIKDFTIFFRADMAALEKYHREGVAPIWRDFYPAFKEKATEVRPFDPRPIPEFKAVTIPLQKVLREEDGRP